MKAVLQRVLSASVDCDGETVSSIGKGFMVLLGVTKDDTAEEADILAAKIVGLRIFSDENGKMNLSLSDVSGEILVVSNFTLCADCSHGRRPSFFDAQRPNEANALYEYFIKRLKFYGVEKVGTGVFGGHMQVHIENEGPVTLILDTEDWK